MATRGEAWLKQGRMVTALEDVNQVLAANPYHPHALAVKGDALFQMCQFEHALVFYERGLKKSTEPLYSRFQLGKVRASESIM